MTDTNEPTKKYVIQHRKGGEHCLYVVDSKSVSRVAFIHSDRAMAEKIERALNGLGDSNPAEAQLRAIYLIAKENSTDTEYVADQVRLAAEYRIGLPSFEGPDKIIYTGPVDEQGYIDERGDPCPPIESTL